MITTINIDELYKEQVGPEKEVVSNYLTKEEADAIPGYVEIGHEYEAQLNGDRRRISHGIAGVQTYNHATGNWEYHSRDYIERYRRKKDG